MKDNKKKKKKTVKKPNFFLWEFFGFFITIWFRIKVKLKTNKLKIEKGSLILSPHRSYFDFFTIPVSIYPKRVHIVATTYWFRNKKLGKFLDVLGVIPKDQYKSDIKAILKISEVLKRGESVLLFPEGQMSPYGNSLYLPNGLDKLIKKFKPNLYFINTSGSYLNSPKWNKGFAKRATIEAQKIKLFSSSEIENKSLDEINKEINKAFSLNNDLEWIEGKDYKYYKKNKIKGLENIICHCPNCNELVPFKNDNLKMVCKKCGLDFEFNDDSYDFKNNKIKNLKELFKIDHEFLLDFVKQNKVLEDEARITYYDNDLNENELFNGIVRMSNEKIEILNPDDATLNITIENDKIINMVNTLNKSFEIPTPLRTYRVYTKNSKRVILYWNYLEILKEWQTNEN